MGSFCTQCNDGDEAFVSSGRSNTDSAKRSAAVKKFKAAVKDAGLSGICGRIQRGMGADDVSALMMPKDELLQTITDLDDEYYEGQSDKIDKLFDICDECMDMMYGD